MPTANSTESNNPPADGGAPGLPGSTEANTANSVAGTGNAEGQGGAPDAGHGASGTAGHSRSSDGIPNMGELVTAIQGMPEAVVRAIREAAPAAQTSRRTSGSQDTGQGSGGSQTGAQTGSQTSGGATQSTGSGKAPGRKSFGEWWFGR